MDRSVHPLDDTTESLRDAVRAFARDRIAPIAASVDRDDHLPRDLWRELGALGVLGITAGPEYEGLGQGYLQHVIAAEEISRASGQGLHPGRWQVRTG